MKNKQVISMLLFCIIISLSACGVSNDTGDRTMPENIQETIAESSEEIDDEAGQEMKNSIMMLNYLEYMSDKIDAVKNNQLLLDEIAKSLRSDIRPNAIDEMTQDQIMSMLNIVEEYAMTDIRKNRLDYLFEQGKARAIKRAIGESTDAFFQELAGVLNGNDAKLALVNTAAKASSEIFQLKDEMFELKTDYMQNCWELDDVARKTFGDNRTKALDYKLKYVREKNIPDEYSVSERDMKTFAEKMEGSASQRQIFLEANESTYKGFEYYWIELANCYFEQRYYVKCLDAATKYEDMKSNIFARDEKLVELLPEVIVSAYNVLDEEEYISAAEKYLKQLEDNVSKDDWETRYFAAKVYENLYDRTLHVGYLDKAYEAVKYNVGNLVDEQRLLNQDYIAEVKLVDVKDNSSKEEKEQIKKYNEFLTNMRSKELPTAYEPLVINCEMLFSLNEKMNIPESEKQIIESAMRPNGEKLFLTSYYEEKYCFSRQTVEKEIAFDKDEINISTALLAKDATVKATVTEGGKQTTYADWEIKKVNRKNGAEGIYTATYTCDSIKKQEWSADSQILIEIFDSGSTTKPVESFRFKVAEYQKLLGVVVKLSFEESK